MRLAINPTRMELIKLKKRTAVAKRGHKLLKEKRDGLMKKFMEIIKEAKTLRETIDQKLAKAFKTFLFATADMRPEVCEESLCYPSQKISLEVATENVMSVRIPRFKSKLEGDWLCYGLVSTPAQLDLSMRLFSEALEDMVKLAQIEHSASLLSQEAERTRRRVNALEYVLIPNLEETSKYITMKLEEQERSALSQLMRVKEVIR